MGRTSGGIQDGDRTTPSLVYTVQATLLQSSRISFAFFEPVSIDLPAAQTDRHTGVVRVRYIRSSQHTHYLLES